MPTYWLNPYISFIESRLFPGFVENAVFHRLSGEIFQPNESVRSMLLASKMRNGLSLGEDLLNSSSGDGAQLRQLLQKDCLIPEGYDPLAAFVNQYVARPIQTPAVAYRATTGEWILVRTSMEHTVYSRKLDDLPAIVEEKLSPLTAGILLMADGSKTLQEIFDALREGGSILE